MQPEDFCDKWHYVFFNEDTKMSEDEKEATELNNASYTFFCGYQG